MKKFIFISCLCIFTVIAGCTNDINNRKLYEKSGNTLNVNNQRTELYNEGPQRSLRNVSSDYGYVRQQKSPIMGDRTNYSAALNREQLANIISLHSTQLPNVNDVAALVTDQEVLVAYRTDSKNRDLTADQVKRTAMSIVPRYYHVYITDNAYLIRDVENLSHLGSRSKNARRNINVLIDRMKKSPQGKPVTIIENANGETADDQIARPNS